MQHLKPLIFFAILSYLLLGLVPLADLVLSAGDTDLAEAAVRASEQTGLVWTSNLLVVLRMSVAEPALFALLLGSLVPALAAILALALMRRPGKWKAFFGRLHPLRGTSVRSAVVTYALIFVVLVPTLVLILHFRQLTGGSYTGTLTTMSLSAFLLILGAAFLDQGAVLEELGWRGFAAPELDRLIDSPLGVALVIGLFWGLWHLPRDVATGVIERLGPADYLALYLPSFLMGTVSVSVIAGYFMNRLGGSVIPAVMIHGIANDSVGISGSASIVQALTPYHQFTKNSLLALVAIAIVVLAGPRLGRRPRPGCRRPVAATAGEDGPSSLGAFPGDREHD